MCAFSPRRLPCERHRVKYRARTLAGRSFEEPTAFCNPESDMQAVRAGSSARGADDDGERDGEGEGEGKSNTTIIVLAVLISLLILAIAVGLGGAGFHVS